MLASQCRILSAACAMTRGKVLWSWMEVGISFDRDDFFLRPIPHVFRLVFCRKSCAFCRYHINSSRCANRADPLCFARLKPTDSTRQQST